MYLHLRDRYWKNVRLQMQHILQKCPVSQTRRAEARHYCEKGVNLSRFFALTLSSPIREFILKAGQKVRIISRDLPDYGTEAIVAAGDDDERDFWLVAAEGYAFVC